MNPKETAIKKLRRELKDVTGGSDTLRFTLSFEALQENYNRARGYTLKILKGNPESGAKCASALAAALAQLSERSRRDAAREGDQDDAV